MVPTAPILRSLNVANRASVSCTTVPKGARAGRNRGAQNAGVSRFGTTAHLHGHRRRNDLSRPSIAGLLLCAANLTRPADWSTENAVP